MGELDFHSIYFPLSFCLWRISANIYLHKKQAHKEVPTRIVPHLQALHIVFFRTMTPAFGLTEMIFYLGLYPQWHYLSVAQWHHHFFFVQWQLVLLSLRYFQSRWTKFTHYDQSDSCRLSKKFFYFFPRPPSKQLETIKNEHESGFQYYSD